MDNFQISERIRERIDTVANADRRSELHSQYNAFIYKLNTSKKRKMPMDKSTA